MQTQLLLAASFALVALSSLNTSHCQPQASPHQASLSSLANQSAPAQLQTPTTTTTTTTTPAAAAAALAPRAQPAASTPAKPALGAQAADDFDWSLSDEFAKNFDRNFDDSSDADEPDDEPAVGGSGARPQQPRAAAASNTDLSAAAGYQPHAHLAPTGLFAHHQPPHHFDQHYARPAAHHHYRDPYSYADSYNDRSDYYGGKYYQYANVPQPHAWNYGYRRGNPYHTIERHERAYGPHFQTKVKWHDKHGGYGVQVYDYNHSPQHYSHLASEHYHQHSSAPGYDAHAHAHPKHAPYKHLY